MWAVPVVEPYPVPQHTAGVLQGFEPVPVGTLLLDRADDPLDHAVLLRAVWGNELLLQSVASDQAGIAAAGEHQATVRAQQEGAWDPPKCAEPRYQSMFQRCLGRLARALRESCQPSSSRLFYASSDFSPALLRLLEAAGYDLKLVRPGHQRTIEDILAEQRGQTPS